MKRDADPMTVDHIIELRKEILKLEKLVNELRRQADNSSDVALKLYLENNSLKAQLKYQEYHGSNTTD